MLALLGELQEYTGSLDIKGKVEYISKKPWIFNGSIKQNIIFGNEYNKDKFEKVIETCCLKKDLEILTLAENTLIGELGISLSRGQKMKICL